MTVNADGRYTFSHNSRMNPKNSHRRGHSIMSSLQGTRMTNFNLVGSTDGKHLFTPPIGSDFNTNASSLAGNRGFGGVVGITG